MAIYTLIIADVGDCLSIASKVEGASDDSTISPAEKLSLALGNLLASEDFVRRIIGNADINFVTAKENMALIESLGKKGKH